MTTEILPSPPQYSSASSSIPCITRPCSNTDGLPQHNFLNHESITDTNPDAEAAQYTRRNCSSGEIGELEGDQLSVLAVFTTLFRKSYSLVGCKTKVSGVKEQQLMEIGSPTNVRHVAHVTFDRFNGFLGLPVEFEPEVPRRPPSASTRVFGVSTESMQLSFDCRGNCVPTILLMMQGRLYSQRGLESEGIFRINPENGQEEYVREQLNNGLIPNDIDVHCLAGLIKAWFRELPRGILDALSPEQVMRAAQSEDECTQLVRLLPPTEAALLDWAINLMADVAQLEHRNKMNARNIAMVFAPNMTQMSDPLTALMYAVQVMNFLKTLIVKTLRERQDSIIEADGSRLLRLEPSDDDRHYSILKPINMDKYEIGEEEEFGVAKAVESVNQAEPGIGRQTTDRGSLISCIGDALTGDGKLGHQHGTDNSLARILNSGSTSMKDVVEGAGNTSAGSGRTHSRIPKTSRPRHSSNHVKKRPIKHTPSPEIHHINEAVEKNEEVSLVRRVNSYRERRAEAWS